MSAPTVYPANPFRKPDLFFKCPKVTSIYTLKDETLQACQKVVAAKQKPPHIKLDDSLQWYDTSRVQRSIIETGRDELQKKDAENRRNPVLIIKDIQNIDADCAATSSRIGVREKEQKRLDLKKVENVQIALTTLCKAVGYDQVVEILKSLSGTQPIVSTQEPVIDQTPPALIRAFKLHLAASEEDVKTTDSLSLLVENAGRRINDLQDKVAAADQLSQQESQLPMIVGPVTPPKSRQFLRTHHVPDSQASTSSGEDMETDTETTPERMLSVDDDQKSDYHDSNEQMEEAGEPDAERQIQDPIHDEDADDEEETDAQPEDISQSEESNSSGHSDQIIKAMTKIRYQSSKIERLEDELMITKNALLWNEVYGVQCEQNDISDISRLINEKQPPPQLREVPLFKMVTSMTLADDFSNQLLRTKGGSLFRWMQTLSSVTHDGNRPSSKRNLTLELCLMWLSAKMHEVVSQGAGITDNTIPHMFHFLRWSIENAQLLCLGRAALFLNVADFTRRTSDLFLWKLLVLSVDDGYHDYPYGRFGAWNVVDRLTFAYTLANGPKQEFSSKMDMDEDEEESYIIYGSCGGNEREELRRLLQANPI